MKSARMGELFLLEGFVTTKGATMTSLRANGIFRPCVKCHASFLLLSFGSGHGDPTLSLSHSQYEFLNEFVSKLCSGQPSSLALPSFLSDSPSSYIFHLVSSGS